MKNVMLRVLAAIVVAAGVPVCAAAQSQQPEAKPGVVRLKLQTEMASSLGRKPVKMQKGVKMTQYADLNRALEKLGAVEIRPAFPYNEKYAAQRAAYGLDQWYEVTFSEAISPKEAKVLMQKVPGVQRAEMKVPMQIVGDPRVIEAKALPKATGAGLPFNDPRLGAQWHYTNDGDNTNMVKGADINLFEAWKTETGKADVVVAIIDGGIDITHEDLAASIWINEAELNGQPGIDDDNDGYVDDIHGYNFCANSGTIAAHSHGTHVAGTVGAINGNGKGVCGVAGGNGEPGTGVRLMSCQVFEQRTGVPAEGDFAAALIYAAEHGASIAQCSWGWSTDNYYEQDVLDAVRYFTNMARSEKLVGGLCIFAAGNDGDTGAFYPQCMPEVLTVGAMTSMLKAASYSNYGEWVDIMAPGGLLDYGEAEGILSTIPGNKYGYMQGTSMACPHVSGVAALVLSKYGNPELPASTLRQQLETSINDFYKHNPGTEGMYGSGYIDAAKALQWSDGEAPSAVTSIALYPAQDNITIEWTIPQASGGSVNYHQLYFSKEPFTADNLGTASMVVVDTKFEQSGTKFRYELGGLETMTTYYIALKAVDRLGNASEMSKVYSATTNRGPKMVLNKTEHVLSVTPGQVARSVFQIQNQDEGILKWSWRTNTLRGVISPYSAEAPRYQTATYTGTPHIEPMAATERINVSDYVADEYPKHITYFDELLAFIGDTEAEVPNSMAQLFTVSAATNPDGFNLTHLNFWGAYGKNPTIQIYRGPGMMTPENLLLEFKPTLWAYYYDVELPEQQHFAPGESFWVVCHFAAESTAVYPLGLATINEASQTVASAHTSFMSNDLGASWIRLDEVLKGSRFEPNAPTSTWGIVATSKNPDWSQIITLNPDGGTVNGKGRQNVILSTVKDMPMCNGTYKFNLYFDTNESEPSTEPSTVTLTVSGNKPKIEAKFVVDFGSVLVGSEKTARVTVFNEGYGPFAGGAYSSGLFPGSGHITSSNANFRGPQAVTTGFPARSYTTFEATFAPIEAGSHSGTIDFKDKDGNTFSVIVQGAATDPAEITIEPSTIEVGDLVPGAAAKEFEFTISNTGKYPLQYAMPKFSDEQIVGAVRRGNVHRFGYTWQSNIGEDTTAEYTELTPLQGAVDVKKSFSDIDYYTGSIDIGFKFPFYGRTYEQVYISSFGTLNFLPYNEGMVFSPLYPGISYMEGLGTISAFGFELATGPDSKIEYAHQDGKFVVNYQNVLAPVYDTAKTPISFRIVLSPNGDIEFYYDDYDPAKVFTKGAILWAGIEDPGQSDPLTVTSTSWAKEYYDEEYITEEEATRYKLFGTGTAVKIVAPQPNMISSVAPVDGYIVPGKSVKVKAKVAATDEMYAGDNLTRLVINSNDPKHPAAYVNFHGTVKGSSLKPELKLGATEVDFGRVFRTSEAVKALTVTNAGKDVMNVTAVAFRDGHFTTEFAVPMQIAAGQSRDINIVLPTEAEGAVEDMITVTTDAGELTAEIRGEVIGCPDIELGYSEIEMAFDAGEVHPQPLKITNTGNETLKYMISVTGDLVSYTPDLERALSTDYEFRAKADDSSVKFEWIDIMGRPETVHHEMLYYLQHDFVEVELPFEFPFYGKKYSKMYVYNTGFVSFTERNDDRIWPEPPGDFPAGTVYTNMVAPYWGLHTMDQTHTAGTYYYLTENQAVVSFIEYGNSLNVGVNYQVIFNADGTFKFQYDKAFELATIFNPFGIAGISDENGRGMRLSDRYIAFGNAIEFTPAVNLELAAGESVDADIVVDGRTIGGKYSAKITVNTNIPGSEKLQIPANIDLKGTPKLVLPDTVMVERPYGWHDFDCDDYFAKQGAYAARFQLANEGTAMFKVTSVDIGGDGMWYEGVFYPENSLWYYGEHERDLDDVWAVDGEGWGRYKGETLVIGWDAIDMAMPVPTKAQIGQTVIPVTFHFEGLGDITEKTVEFVFNITEVPAATLSRDVIEVKNVGPNDEKVETIRLTNTGKYTLHYGLQIDPTGKGIDYNCGAGYPDDDDDIDYMAARMQPAQARMLTSEGRIETFEVGKPEQVLDAPQDMAYSKALYYPVAPDVTHGYAFGPFNSSDEFGFGTAFTGPEGGINISHIYTYLLLQYLHDVDVHVQIIDGVEPYGERVLGEGVYHIGTVDPEETPYLLTAIPLDKPVFINEGQDFYVIVSVPAGFPYVTYLIAKSEAVVDYRYVAYQDTYSWYDAGKNFNDKYGSLGYIMTCIETVPGAHWAQLLNEQTTGELEPGESVDISVKLVGAGMPLKVGNRSMLMVETDDPAQHTINVPIIADMNAAPQVEADQESIVVPQGSKVTVHVAITDPENDDLAIQIDDNGGFAKVVNFVARGENAEVTDHNGISEVNGSEGVDAEIEIEADFTAVGNYQITVTAMDRQMNVTRRQIAYTIDHVNRAPVAKPILNHTIMVGGVTEIINFDELFEDPDGDELTYKLQMTGAQFVTVYEAENSIVIVGKSVGRTTIYVTATDPSGASVYVRFQVIVTEPQGIDDIRIDSSVGVYPNPTAEDLNVTLDFSAADVEYTLYGISGAAVLSERADAEAGRPHRIGMGGLPAGTYLLRVTTTDGRTGATVVVKQ